MSARYQDTFILSTQSYAVLFLFFGMFVCPNPERGFQYLMPLISGKQYGQDLTVWNLYNTNWLNTKLFKLDIIFTYYLVKVS